MHNDKESPFTLTLLDGDLSLQVLQFSGREALNQPYRFDIEVIGLAPALNLERLLHQPAFLEFGHDQGIHGVLHSAGCEHRSAHRVAYKLVLVPRVQALDQQRCRRVFQRASVPMILSGMRISIGIAWFVIVAAEMVGAQSGIGYFIWNEWNNLQIASMIVAIVLIGGIGLALDVILKQIGERLSFRE